MALVDAALAADAEVNLSSLDLNIKDDDDDAEEDGSNLVSLQGQKLSLGAYGSSSGRTIGLRYRGADIPAGSTIVRAPLQFTAAE